MAFRAERSECSLQTYSLARSLIARAVPRQPSPRSYFMSRTEFC